MDYPGRCIKGIPNDTFLVEDGTVGSQLFHFKEEHKRDDGFIEESINWEDDRFAIRYTLTQRMERKGKRELQFKAGVAIINREEIDRLKKQLPVRGRLLYERQRLENNPYHGNILLDGDVPTSVMKMIAAGLALAVSDVVLR
jgi:hypothetical protein